MKLRHLICFGMLFLQTTFANAQSDTVQYRLLTSFLNDSTLIRYELGSLGLQVGSSLTYLSFPDSTPTTVAGWFKSVYFTLHSSSDTISLFRFAAFDDKHCIGATAVDTASSSSRSSFFDRIKSRYEDTLFYVTPDTSVFDSTSCIRYIIEVHDSATGTVIARIDTLKCFLHRNKLVYATFPQNGTFRRRALGDMPLSETLYLTVGRSSSLKPSGSLIADQFTVTAYNPAATAASNEYWQEFEVGNIFGPMDFILPAKVRLQGLSSSTIGFDHEGNNILLDVQLKRAAQLTITVSNEAGQVVSTFAKSASSGRNRLTIDASRLPSGVYFVQISNGGVTLTRGELSIIH